MRPVADVEGFMFDPLSGSGEGRIWVDILGVPQQFWETLHDNLVGWLNPHWPGKSRHATGCIKGVKSLKRS